MGDMFKQKENICKALWQHASRYILQKNAGRHQALDIVKDVYHSCTLVTSKHWKRPITPPQGSG